MLAPKLFYTFCVIDLLYNGLWWYGPSVLRSALPSLDKLLCLCCMNPESQAHWLPHTLPLPPPPHWTLSWQIIMLSVVVPHYVLLYKHTLTVLSHYLSVLLEHCARLFRLMPQPSPVNSGDKASSSEDSHTAAIYILLTPPPSTTHIGAYLWLVETARLWKRRCGYDTGPHRYMLIVVYLPDPPIAINAALLLKWRSTVSNDICCGNYSHHHSVSLS